ncbi:hypothetical protein HZA99_03760 [Candidatus Woesearchaeota archaeon]|nr:hypothetical protein [Candidatus Woesearchaeota archaeon]
MESIIQEGQEPILSRYKRETLVERLASYNSEDALVVIDIDDCVRDSPAKRMAMLGLLTPALVLPNICWAFYTAKEIASEVLHGGSIKDAETASFAYYREYVLGELSAEERKELAERAVTPLYHGAQDFVGYFPRAFKIIVSRNICEIVDKTVQELRCNRGYAEQDNKRIKVFDSIRTYDPKRVLIVGDSQEDAAPISDIQAKGVAVDFVYVMKGNNPRRVHPDATISVTRRDFTPLYSLLTG